MKWRRLCRACVWNLQMTDWKQKCQGMTPRPQRSQGQPAWGGWCLDHIRKTHLPHQAVPLNSWANTLLHPAGLLLDPEIHIVLKFPSQSEFWWACLSEGDSHWKRDGNTNVLASNSLENAPGMEHDTESSATGCLPAPHWEASYRGHQGCELPLMDFTELSGVGLSKAAFLPEGYALRPRKPWGRSKWGRGASDFLKINTTHDNMWDTNVTNLQAIPTMERPGSVLEKKSIMGRQSAWHLCCA